MTTHNTSNKSNDKYQKNIYKTLNNDEKIKEDIQLIEHSKDNIMLDSNNLELHSSQLVQNKDHVKNNITELKICNGDFTELNQALHYPCDLKNLLLNNNMIKSIPIGISNFYNLNVLNLSHNQITSLPDNLSKLKNLETLDVSYNKLRDLPYSFGKLQRLIHLDISNNYLSSIPMCISGGMGTLKYLNISKNSRIRMNIIPYSKYLEIFYAKENGNCDKFPDWILTPKFFNLKEFDLDGTFFNTFTFIGKDGDLSITNFSMCGSSLTSPILEHMIKNMVKLEKMNVANRDELSGNMFNNIPIHELKNPSTITELNFCNTGISSLPNTINQLLNLTKLDLSLNCISWFPEEFCKLSKLIYLNISGNGLIMFPNNFGNLNLLQELWAENNYLTHLPSSFKELKNLRLLDLYNNMFEEFPDPLCHIDSLHSLDLEQNFFTTDNVKIKEISYSTLYSSLIELNPKFNFRNKGSKKTASIKSDSCHSYSHYGCVSDDEERDNISECKKDNVEENWDSVIDTDDEFEPGGEEINYNALSIKYTLDVSNGFCPADLHPKKVTAEVACMRKYGSLPTYVIEQGQFDDA